jgi:translation initiation factor IF-3
MAHQEIGVRLLERVRGDLEPYGVVEQFPKMEGRQLVMVLSPKKTGVVGKPGPASAAKGNGAPKKTAVTGAKAPAAASKAGKVEANQTAPEAGA